MPWTYRGWAGVVSRSPLLVRIRMVGVCSWVKVLVTVEVVGWPVSGSVQATWSPTATSSMGLVVPSAMRTGVPAGKHGSRPTEETTPTPAPMVPPMAAWSEWFFSDSGDPVFWRRDRMRLCRE